MLGSGNSTFPILEDSQARRKARTGCVTQELGGCLGPRVGGEGTKCTGSLALRLGAMGLMQCSCSQPAATGTKGRWGAADCSRLEAGSDASSKGLGWVSPSMVGGLSSCQAEPHPQAEWCPYIWGVG